MKITIYETDNIDILPDMSWRNFLSDYGPALVIEKKDVITKTRKGVLINFDSNEERKRFVHDLITWKNHD